MGLFKKHACDICGAKFSQVEQLMNHIQIIHGKDLQYDCRECGETFPSMEDMRTHIQRMHSYERNTDAASK